MRYEQISELLNGIAERFDWDKVMEGDFIIGLIQVRCCFFLTFSFSFLLSVNLLSCCILNDGVCKLSMRNELLQPLKQLLQTTALYCCLIFELSIDIGQGKQSISLEPGGQFELSGAPLETLHQTCAEVNSHLYQVS